MKTQTLLLIMTGLCLMMFSGCTAGAGSFGRLAYNDKVKNTFEAFTVPPGYRFYYFGSESLPKAFLGVAENYQLETDLWQPVNLTSGMLRNWIWGLSDRTAGDYSRYGSDIIGPDGEHIGIYYSLEDWKQWVTVEKTADRTIRISSPMKPVEPLKKIPFKNPGAP